MKRYILVAAVCFLAACTDPKTARLALETGGYTDIKMTGYDFFGCTSHDKYRTGFTAMTPNGKKVKGVVCSGIMKNPTVRFQ